MRETSRSKDLIVPNEELVGVAGNQLNRWLACPTPKQLAAPFARIETNEFAIRKSKANSRNIIAALQRPHVESTMSK